MTDLFELEITDQHWLGETHEQRHDGCSHGGIRAAIAGTVVTSDDTEYGISQSALSLLRTLDQDHSRAEPVSGGYLLCHGCGYPTHFGCGNFGTDWVVRHEGDAVVLSQPSHFDAFAGEQQFDVRVTVPIDDYRRHVIAFAETASAFYTAAGRRQLEAWERELHDQFWTEFDDRLMRASSGRRSQGGLEAGKGQT